VTCATIAFPRVGGIEADAAAARTSKTDELRDLVPAFALDHFSTGWIIDVNAAFNFTDLHILSEARGYQNEDDGGDDDHGETG
jgi:hypothetical protein